jgi:hypothetical protein
MSRRQSAGDGGPGSRCARPAVDVAALELDGGRAAGHGIDPGCRAFVQRTRHAARRYRPARTIPPPRRRCCWRASCRCRPSARPVRPSRPRRVILPASRPRRPHDRSHDCGSARDQGNGQGAQGTRGQGTRGPGRPRARAAPDRGEPAAVATGTVRIAISPWGNVEVDGAASGVAPPLTELTLAEGRHQIVVRNGDFAPFVATVNVVAGQTASIRHKFGGTGS